MTNLIQHPSVYVSALHSFPTSPAAELSKIKTTAKHALARTVSGWACVVLGLLSLHAHALSLGNLTVSSNASPSFTASLPFSDDKPVRLPELQARLGTDAEYAQWGMQMTPAIRELRVRVVPASQTVGYIELFSLTNLSQDNFDLLIWASYAGRTMLTHYKVNVLDVPSLIKGKTLSTSVTSATIRQGKELPLKTPSQVEAQAPALVAEPSTTKLIEATSVKDSETAPPTAAAQPVNQPPIAEEVARPHQTLPADANANNIFGSGMAIGVFSLMLFLFGFWMGRLRRRIPTDTTSMSPHPAVARAALTVPPRPSKAAHETPRAPTTPSSTAPLAPSFHAQPLRDPLQMPPSPSTFNQSPAAMSATEVASPTASEAPFVKAVPDTSEAAEVQTSAELSATARFESWPAPPEPFSTTVMPSAPLLLHAEPVASDETAPSLSTSTIAPVTLVTRTPATALPTPGLASVSVRPNKTIKTKSLGNSNIDLAKIYMSMGDPTTAQLLLQQVMEQGTATERAQAELLMQEMV